MDGTSLNSNMVQHKQSDTEVLAGIEELKEKVTILKYNNQFIGLSPVYDYIYQCEALCHMCLYDWVARCEQTKLPKKRKSNSREKDKDNGHDVTKDGSPIDKCPSSHPSFHDSRMTSSVFPLLLEHPLAMTHGT